MTVDEDKSDWLECPCCERPAFAPLPEVHLDGTPSPCGCQTWWRAEDDGASFVAWDDSEPCDACKANEVEDAARDAALSRLSAASCETRKRLHIVLWTVFAIGLGGFLVEQCGRGWT